MREGRSPSSVEPGWGWLGAVSLVLALVGIVLLVAGLFESALGGLDGGRPTNTAFVVGAVCGLLSVLAGVVGWLKTKGRGAVRAWPAVAGLIGGLVLVVGVRGAYENRPGPIGACPNWDSPPPAGMTGTFGVLNGVATTSPSDAWAVGWCGRPWTLILRWDGSTWERERSPNGSTGHNYLYGVAATSSSDAWAVGEYAAEGVSANLPLILHWDGRRWTQKPTPTDGQSFYSLRAVAATSSSDAWAVGLDPSGAVILHWDGTAWTRQLLPELGPSIYPSLFGVAATSPSNAWAVGSYGGFGEPVRGVIFRWDGSTWSSQLIPHVGTGGNSLAAVSATSSSNAWAVGSYEDGTGQRALILHWDGDAWTHQPSPEASIGIGSGESLNGVAATSPSNAWAVGTRGQDGLVLCWNGSTWTERSSPSVGTGANILNGVTALSAAKGWAVGVNSDGTVARTLVAPCQ